METITIKLPIDTAKELLSLIKESCNTDNEEWDEHMKLVKNKLEEKL